MSSEKSNKNNRSKQAFRKLAWKNVQKSAKDYMIYFFTLSLSVGLFYSFNSISTQFSALGLEDRLNYLTFTTSILAAVSVFVCFVIGSLVVYANRFMLKRRKKEIGIYYSLGMEQADLNRLLTQETLFIGSASLITGLALGIFSSQILTFITAKLIGAELSAFHFVISVKALLISILFFGLLFFFVYKFNIREIKKMTLLELMYADRQNETVLTGGGIKEAFSFILSLIFIGAGYFCIFFTSENSFLSAVSLGILLLVAGTFLFLLSACGIVIRGLKKKKSFYYKKLNLFVVGQMETRLKREGKSMALTTCLLFLSIFLSILGLGLGKYLMKDITMTVPYDASISWYLEEVETRLNDPEERLKENGFYIGDYAKDSETIWLCHEDGLTSAIFQMGEKGSEEESVELTIIGLDDYNRSLRLQGKQPVLLEQGEYAINYNSEDATDMLMEFAESPQLLKIGNTTLHLADQGIFKNSLRNVNVLMDYGTIIVPQYLAENLKPYTWILNLNYLGNGREAYEALAQADINGKLPLEFSLSTKEDTLISITSGNLIMTYLGIYLGITFLITTGAVLALQQLSQASDNKKRYQILRRLGTRKADMRHSILTQLKIYFGLPLMIAIVHSVVMLAGIFKNLTGLSFGMLGGMVLLYGGLVLLIYGLYYITTYLGNKRILDL